MLTQKYTLILPDSKNPRGGEIVVEITVSTLNGVVQAMTAKQVVNWNQQELQLSN